MQTVLTTNTIPWCAAKLAAQLWSCCRSTSSTRPSRRPNHKGHVNRPREGSPVGLVQDDDFVLAWWQRDLRLRKQFDFVSHDVNAAGGQVEASRVITTRQQCRRHRARSGQAPTHRSSEAFNSRTPSRNTGPSSACARHRTLVVLPVPGGPCAQPRRRHGVQRNMTFASATRYTSRHVVPPSAAYR